MWPEAGAFGKREWSLPVTAAAIFVNTALTLPCKQESSPEILLTSFSTVC